MDFTTQNITNLTSAVKVADNYELMKEMNSKVLEEKNKLAIQEQENHDNLKSITNNSNEMVTLLRRHIELLEETNEKLEANISEITNVLSLIFNTDVEQKEQMQQISALACQISETLDRGEKIDWKDKAADAGIQMTLAGICMALRMRGINI